MAVPYRYSLLFAALISSAAGAKQIVTIADRDVDGLVAAIHAANQSPDQTTIRLAKGGLYTLVTATDEKLEIGLPVISGRVAIDGNGADLRRYSNDDFALFAVAKGGALSLSELTLSEGSRGAIVNHGELSLSHVRVIDNVAKGTPAIIENYGELSVRDSEISYNQIAATQRDAGTVLNFGTLELTRSSIESNWISRRFDTLIAASAVLNLGDMKLRAVKVRENTVSTEEEGASLAAIVNAGNGAYEASDLLMENNEPVDTTSVVRRVN